jgi:hypothetical protein
MNKKYEPTGVPPINPQRVTRLLSQGTDQLDDEIVLALRKARYAALQNQQVHQPFFSLSVIGDMAHLPHTPQQWFVTAILMVTLAVGGYGYWQSTQDPVDLDILTDSLPIDVFVDQ